MVRNRSLLSSTGQQFAPLTGDDLALLNACDDAPRKKFKRNAIKSAECKQHKHRACSSSPCNCPCHEPKPSSK
jgi:hypothetical protein